MVEYKAFGILLCQQPRNPDVARRSSDEDNAKERHRKHDGRKHQKHEAKDVRLIEVYHHLATFILNVFLF